MRSRSRGSETLLVKLHNPHLFKNVPVTCPRLSASSVWVLMASDGTNQGQGTGPAQIAAGGEAGRLGGQQRLAAAGGQAQTNVRHVRQPVERLVGARRELAPFEPRQPLLLRDRVAKVGSGLAARARAKKAASVAF